MAFHEFLDHTSEVRLRVRGDSFADVVAEAGEAIGRLLRDEVGDRGAAAARTVHVTGRDPEALLVHWLNEIVYVAEVEQWVPTRVREVVVEGDTLRVSCTGVQLARAPSRVKAATFHGLRARAVDGETEVEVVLDV